MNRDRLRKALASEVRTGDTITNDYAIRRRLTLTVDHTIWATNTSHDGTVLPVIWFAGTQSDGKHVTRGWGWHPDRHVYVVMDAPLKGDVPGSGVFGALNADEPDDVDGWPDDSVWSAADGTELL